MCEIAVLRRASRQTNTTTPTSMMIFMLLKLSSNQRVYQEFILFLRVSCVQQEHQRSPEVAAEDESIFTNIITRGV